MIDYSGRHALVTGGCHGIGRAIVDRLAALGARVSLLDLPGVIADLTVTPLRQGIVAIPADVADPGSLASAFAVCSAAQPLDLVVCNAGVNQHGATEHYAAPDFAALLAINTIAVQQTMACAVRAWRSAGRGGAIVNIASFAGLVADPGSAAYAASKGAVVQLTRTCAVDWAPFGIRVNAVAPGYVRTRMTQAALDGPRGESIRARIPLGRAAEPGEIADAVAFLGSPAAAYVTGAVLPVDGGWTAQ